MHLIKSIIEKSRKLHGTIDFNGLQISIETGRSRIREWHNPHDGSQGMSRMLIPYGYIKRTLGVDGDHYDCFVGPDRTAPMAYIITTMKAPDFTEVDEEKVMLGLHTEEEAKRAYLASYNDPRFFGSITEVPFEEFKERVLATKDNPVLLGEHKFFRESDVREAARRAYKKAFIAAGGDWNANIPEEVYAGMKHELEHADVTGGDLVLTAKIALAHLREDRKYYSKLESMEMAKAMRQRAGIHR